MTDFPTVPRPKLARWFWERRIGRAQRAELIGCGEERAYRMILPFGEPLRAMPTDDELANIIRFTDGEVTPADFYPPHLNEAHAALEAAPQ